MLFQYNDGLISWSETLTSCPITNEKPPTLHTTAVKISPSEVRPRNYKQQRRTPLLFLTGKSPEVIFPLPWNKSMKHNSLWTTAHLLKSDVGWGASHHRAYSVCWQNRPLINKGPFFETGAQAWVQFWEAIQKTAWWERACVCLLVPSQPFW